MYKYLTVLALIVLLTMVSSSLESVENELIARGGRGGAGRGGAGRPAGGKTGVRARPVQRTPSLSRAARPATVRRPTYYSTTPYYYYPTDENYDETGTEQQN